MATNAVLHHHTPVISVQGIFHDLDIFPDRLVIHRTDVISRLFGSEEIIFYKDIKGLHTYNPSLVVNKWSQLIIVTNNGKSRALSYGASQRHIAQHVKETVEELISNPEPALA